MSQISGGYIAPGAFDNWASQPLPPITPEQARAAALHVVTFGGDDAGELLEMLGLEELL